LIGAATVPFFLLYSCAIDWSLRRIKAHSLRFAVLAAIAFVVSVPQMFLNAPVFSSRFNFFHMSGRS
jgi:hypothetical protein